MTYNWQNIYKSKTNKELYDIYIGKISLSKEAQEIAKQELERRDFDFENMEVNYKAWKVLSLNEERKTFNLDILNQKRFFISLKHYLIFVVVALTIIMALSYYQEFEGSYSELLTFLILSGVMVLLNNLMFRIQETKRKKRNREILDLTNEIGELQKEGTSSNIFNDISIVKARENERIKTMYYIIFGILGFSLLIIGLYSWLN